MLGAPASPKRKLGQCPTSGLNSGWQRLSWVIAKSCLFPFKLYLSW